MPEEIKALGDRVLIAFVRGEPPILCQRIDYREREEWKQTWDENPLQHTRNMDNSFLERLKKYLKTTSY